MTIHSRAHGLSLGLASFTVLLASLSGACVIAASDSDGEDGEGGSPNGGSSGVSTSSGPSAEEAIDDEPTWAVDGIHVAPNGSDESGDGSAGAPYRTIQYALDNAASAGATVLLHEGVYEEEVRIRHSDLLLQSAVGENAHITLPVSADEDTVPTGIYVGAETSGVVLRGLEVSGGFYAIAMESQWDWDATPQDNLAASDVTIEDCILHDTGRDVVKLPSGSDNITVRRCEIYNSGMSYPPGTVDRNAEGIDAVNADNFRVADTYIHDTSTTCLYVKGGSQNTVIERVRAERCGEMGIALGFETSPEWFDLVANPGYYENINGVVRNSIVRDTGWAGIAIFASQNARVLHNTIIDSAHDLQSAIYFGAVIQDEDPNAGRPPNENPTIIGNIVDQTGVPDAQCVSIRYSPADKVEALYGLAGPLTMRNNIYHSDGACAFTDNRPESFLELGDLVAWQSHAEGFDVGSVLADPLLDGEGFLTDGSPAIDALDATDGVLFGFRQNPRTAPFDIGADER
jgi:hypothetical protein